jgi:hypothetical protein
MTLTLRFKKKRKGEFAILLNFKNNVLPWSEVTRVAGGQYQPESTYSKVTECYAVWCFLKGPKKTKEMRLLQQSA